MIAGFAVFGSRDVCLDEVLKTMGRQFLSHVKDPFVQVLDVCRVSGNPVPAAYVRGGRKVGCLRCHGKSLIQNNVNSEQCD